MPETESISSLYVVESSTTPSILNSLLKFPSGDTTWGLLTWIEISEEPNYISIDILKNSDNSVLVEGLKGIETGVPNIKAIDLSKYSEIGSNDIKIRFNRNIINKTPILRKVTVLPKQKW